jgi:hypothetical protein
MPPWRIQMECRRESQVPRDIPKCAKFKPWFQKRQPISKGHKKGDSQSKMA